MAHAKKSTISLTKFNSMLNTVRCRRVTEEPLSKQIQVQRRHLVRSLVGEFRRQKPIRAAPMAGCTSEKELIKTTSGFSSRCVHLQQGLAISVHGYLSQGRARTRTHLLRLFRANVSARLSGTL